MKYQTLLTASLCCALLAGCTAAQINGFLNEMTTSGGSSSTQCDKSDLDMNLGKAKWVSAWKTIDGSQWSYDANSISYVDDNPDIVAIRARQTRPENPWKSFNNISALHDKHEQIFVFYCQQKRWEMVRSELFYRNKFVRTFAAGDELINPDMNSPYYGYSNNARCGAQIRIGSPSESLLNAACGN